MLHDGYLRGREADPEVLRATRNRAPVRIRPTVESEPDVARTVRAGPAEESSREETGRDGVGPDNAGPGLTLHVVEASGLAHALSIG